MPRSAVEGACARGAVGARACARTASALRSGRVGGCCAPPRNGQKGARLAHPVLEALGLIIAFD